ncbi:hypothetical protein Tco_1345506 [Tanacetum coccineum]
MSNTNLQTQSSSVLQNVTVSSCSASNIQEKTQLSRKFEERMRNYTRYNAQSFNDAMICTMDSIRKYMLEIILHQQRTLHLLKQKTLMQTQEDHSHQTQAVNTDSLKVDLVVKQNSCSEKEDSNLETASSKSAKECSLNSETQDVYAIKYKIQMTDTYFVEYTGIEVKHFRDTLLQHLESKIDTGKALDADLVDKESIRSDSTDADDADIRPIYDAEPMAEVQLTAKCNIFAIGQQHTEQPEIIIEGRVDQYPETCQVKSPMLDSSHDNQTTEYSKQSLESENILLKKTVAQFQKDFSRMEAHCIALELKYQNQALKSGQHGQILNEKD